MVSDAIFTADSKSPNYHKNTVLLRGSLASGECAESFSFYFGNAFIALFLLCQVWACVIHGTLKSKPSVPTCAIRWTGFSGAGFWSRALQDPAGPCGTPWSRTLQDLAGLCRTPWSTLLQDPAGPCRIPCRTAWSAGDDRMRPQR